jgi:4-hydroxybutyryl-CoA dehydratase/vinylacetyl-CoA-Delta-isomerase
MRTKEQYIQGLSKMKRNIYFDGQRIDRTDEIQRDCLNTIGTTYDEAAKPENEKLLTAVSRRRTWWAVRRRRMSKAIEC